MTTTETTEQAAPAETTEVSKVDAKGDMTKIVSKEPTNLHTHYWGWLQEKTGYTTDTPDETAVKIVQMAVSLYQKYQASPENKQRRLDEADAREKAAEEAKAAKAAAAAEKAREKAAAAESAKAESEAAGEGDEGAKRQAPPKKGRAAASANKAAAGEAPF